MSFIKFLDLIHQNNEIKKTALKKIESTVDNSDFINGEIIDNFEKNVSKFFKSKFAIGVSNGTDALELALRALDLPENSEVIIPANSFVATAISVVKAKLKPILSDIDPDTFLLNAELITNRITKKTKAIIPVHLYGQSK